MYIFEVFTKWLKKNKRGSGANPENIYKESKLSDYADDSINCNHNFMPVDSTGEVLACTKCGFVINKKSNN